jgi:hypothetical protein
LGLVIPSAGAAMYGLNLLLAEVVGYRPLTVVLRPPIMG